MRGDIDRYLAGTTSNKTVLIAVAWGDVNGQAGG